ncbi:MAG: threonine--tRNA ligase [Alphaproteobacteria bacterium CG_4_10_14_0_8_um_filter_53_9]|nr:MAG: threonine--tRNA ligase [Alphaproteobacteria bacterium CG_4_10_14_0_8_um_filter_53_9]
MPAPLQLTLPDGSVREMPAGTTGAQLAASIGAGLAKAAVGIVNDDKQQDLSEPLKSGPVRILTLKDAEGLDIARHSATAQALAAAVKEMFPGTKLAIGPTIDDGFYYDVDFSEAKRPLSADDLPALEAKMREVLATDAPITRELWAPEDLKAHFTKTGDTYKNEIIDGAIEKGQLIDGKVSVYRNEKTGFIDLCVGPHVPHLGLVPASFALSSLAGAYWRGDSANQQLTRIYGRLFATQKELDAYLHMRAEAEKRDHRKIGPALDLFHFQDIAPGQAFWHARGWSIYTELTNYMRHQLDTAGYEEVNSPQLVHKSLYEASGHWENYFEDLFLVKEEREGVVKDIYSLKPMNCPCHVQIFNFGIKSYRDLPLRMAEFGSCMRNEAHGALHGLMRVTGFKQDDAHIFCTEDQMMEESARFCELLHAVYQDLGFTDYFVKLSTRPDKRVGSDDVWDKAEAALAEACKNSGLGYVLSPGDGAFYGPKLEFVLRDCIGRDWQCGTLQVDFNTAARLGAHYTTESGERLAPVMLHRAILGSLERFIGILIEQYEGKFPLWLAPVQAMVVPITDHQNTYAEEVAATLRHALPTATGGLRVEVDDSSERMQKKILLAQQQKIPYMLVVGAKEAEAGTVAVRLRDGTDLGAMPLTTLTQRLKDELSARQ